jgi:antitoxin ParD1/3/4
MSMPSDSLPPDLAQFVSDQLARGRYESESAVMCDAVRLLREREERLVALRADVDRGVAQLAAGEFSEMNSDDEIDAYFDEFLKRAAERAGQAKESP